MSRLSGSDLDDKDLEFVWKIRDLKALCPKLREVIIEHSSVSKDSVERLRKLLPGVAIRYSGKAW
jgi:hypothetical protein